ncbi:hypothetical protein D9M69_659540 [compost metagenome]
MLAFVADFEHQNARRREPRGQVAQQRANEIHAVGATGQGQCWLGGVFGGQLAHALRVHVGRVAQHQVVGAGAGREPVGFDECDAVLQPVAFHIDAGHGQRLGGDVGTGDLHVGPGHGG